MKLTKTCSYWQPEMMYWILDKGSRCHFDIEIHGEVVAYWRRRYGCNPIDKSRPRIELGRITAQSDDTITFDKITKKEAEAILNSQTTTTRTRT